MQELGKKIGDFIRIWLVRIFNGWALFLSFCVFLPIGFYIGYEVKQPSLVTASTRQLLMDVDNIEKLLVDAQAKGASGATDASEKLRSLKADLVAIRTAADNLPKASRDDIRSKVDASLKDAEAADTAYYITARNFDQSLAAYLGDLRKQRQRIFNGAEASKDVPSVLYDQLRRFLKWTGAVSFFCFFMLCVLLILWLSSPSFRNTVARSGSLSAFGVTINFNDLQSVRASITARERALGSDIVETYTNTLKRSKLNAQFQNVMQEIVGAFRNAGVNLSAIPYRATLFVPGFVGQELIQATRYSGNWRLGDEKVIGRRFSVRFGIIGKAWRLQGSQYFPKVENGEKALLREWGFTQEEIMPHAAIANPVAGCLMAFSINDIGNAPPLGVIYLEAEGSDKLHPANPPQGPLSAMNLVGDGSGMTTADRFADDEIWKKLSPSALQKLKDQLIRLQTQLRWNDKIQDGVGR
ncbi:MULTISPECIES: hypothetical protein [Asticcacaulis]|uniref:hypothetical protein n=1 Tax=Asticcacaulis TaxID=76890 RepID=UPI001AE7747C|nr:MULTISPECIES: hypothetical protein [Asticcacaulis]MBP2161251.1 hypothetical protein [Asticcacaulis solisilvae]MDR6802383.1 hypothetical protein [Asticcacaulis sp. BE141]